jgi:hypothetical protein
MKLSNKLDLFIDKDGQIRPIYILRHSPILSKRSKVVDANVNAIHSNTSAQMVNTH